MNMLRDMERFKNDNYVFIDLLLLYLPLRELFVYILLSQKLKGEE